MSTEAPPTTLEALLEAVPVAMLGVGPDGRIELANEQAAELFGYPRAELVGGPVDMLVPERFRSEHAAHRGRYAEDARARPMGAGPQLFGLRRDGTEFPVEISLSPLVSDRGSLTISAIRDITDRREIEAESRHARQQEAVAALGQRALLTDDLDALLQEAADLVSDMLELDLAQVLEPDAAGDAGRPAGLAFSRREIVVFDDLTADERLPAADVLRGQGIVAGVAVPMLSRDRALGVLIACARRPRDFSSDEIHFLQLTANVVAAATERSQADVALRLSRERLQAVLDNSPAIIYLKDTEGRQLLVNRRYERLYGLEPGSAIGRTDAELFPAPMAEAFGESDRVVLATRAPLEVEEYVVDAAGRERVFISLKFPLLDADGDPYGLGGVSTDITDRVREAEEKAQLEARLHQSQRLESVGRLAGGIAHDFNNLLAVIQNFAAFVKTEVPPGTQAAEDVDQILRAVRRASDLIRQLLMFSRREAGNPEALDLGEVVGDVEKLLLRTLGAHIDLRVYAEPSLGRVRADRGQLEQVLMNLAINARDAMKDGGALSIETLNADPGHLVSLVVTDTGHGMEPADVERAFEPFFSTKPPGEGTGLGLATVYGIVTGAGGTVDIESRPGEGTTVVVHLPVTGHDVARTPAGGGQAPSHGHGETVLVVEDEPAVREAARRILATAGYEVVVAVDAEDALEANALMDSVDLLLTDVVMPGASGRELADRLLERRPGLRVVFMSGYADDVHGRHGALPPGSTLIEKPFAADSLLAVVGEELAGAGAAQRPGQ